MPSSVPGGETLGGEWAIWWNGHHLIQTAISHGGASSWGPRFSIPRLCPPPTGHLFPVSSRPHFGFVSCLMRSLLSHLISPLGLLRKISLHTLEMAPGCSQCCESECQSWGRRVCLFWVTFLQHPVSMLWFIQPQAQPATSRDRKPGIEGKELKHT